MSILKCSSVVLSVAIVVSGCSRGGDTAPAAVDASAPAVSTPAAPAEAAVEKPRVPSEANPASLSPEAANASAPDGQPGVNPQGHATLEFQNRLTAYLKIHNEAESQVPNLRRTDDPQEISDREARLAKAIQGLRATAKAGDIFAVEYQPYFIKIVQDDFTKRSPADRKALVNELPKDMKAGVNTVYPTDLPLATFPAALLRKLPDLPPELEYRLIGRSLILRDVKANLIVDILRDVVPTIPS